MYITKRICEEFEPKSMNNWNDCSIAKRGVMYVRSVVEGEVGCMRSASQHWAFIGRLGWEKKGNAPILFDASVLLEVSGRL